MNDDSKDFFTPSDLIKILPIGRDKVYELIRSPGFPAVKIGRTYIIKKTSFEKWLKTYEGKEYFL